MRVLLVRHGETDWNVAGKIQGASDIPLNAAGRSQAEALAGKIAAGGMRPGIIYSSPLKRALETARIAGRTLGVEVIAAPELTELSFGCWEGCSWDEVGERWPGQFEAYAADRRNYAPPGGESYADMLRRAKPFVDALRRAPGGEALCVCHSAVIRGLISEELGLSIGESYRRLKLANTIIVPLDSAV